MLWGCKGKELRGEPVEVTHIYPFESLVPVAKISVGVLGRPVSYSLFQAKVSQPAQSLLFRFPYSIDDILHVKDIICLTVSSVPERHQWRIGLRNGC